MRRTTILGAVAGCLTLALVAYYVTTSSQPTTKKQGHLPESFSDTPKSPGLERGNTASPDNSSTAGSHVAGFAFRHHEPLRQFEDLFEGTTFRPVFVQPSPQNHLYDASTEAELDELKVKVRNKKLPRDNISLRQLMTHSTRPSCTLSNCFDHQRCKEFLIYVYPDEPLPKQTLFFKSMLKYFRTSPFYTDDPTKACLFIPSIDTSDRDPLSPDYIQDAESKLLDLPYWNDGRNHLLFNTFPGSYPQYFEHMDFNTRQAMLVKSCFTLRTFREDFDISFPHYKPDSKLPETVSAAPGTPKRYLATFKGKRYLYGVGKEIRENLRVADNGKDVIVLTTCIHLPTWERFADADCPADNERYTQFEYDYLLKEATFSYVPRGRRINTFRFLEVIAVGSIPVVLGDEFIMPFQDMIQWDGAAVFIPEEMVEQSGAMLQAYSPSDVFLMQQRLKYIWETHLASFDKALTCVAETLRQRIFPKQRRPFEFWNGPFAFPSTPTFFRRNLPLALTPAEVIGSNHLVNPRRVFGEYTIVILVHDRFDVMFDMIKVSLARTTRMDKLIIIMNNPGTNEPPQSDWPTIYCPIEVYRIQRNSLNNRFLPIPSINTEAVMALDDDVYLEPQEIEFGYETWKQHPDQLVGWPARRHIWDGTRWTYNSDFSSSYSMILTGAAFYHRKYNEIYSTSLPREVYDMVAQKMNCEDIAMNYLVSSITRKPPVKVTGRWTFPCKKCVDRKLSTHTNGGLVAHLESRSECMDQFAHAFGYQPLILTWSRNDPVIYDGKTAQLITNKNAFPIPEPA